MIQGFYWEAAVSPMRHYMREYLSVAVPEDTLHAGLLTDFDTIVYCPAMTVEQKSGTRHGYGYPGFGTATDTGQAVAGVGPTLLVRYGSTNLESITSRKGAFDGLSIVNAPFTMVMDVTRFRQGNSSPYEDGNDHGGGWNVTADDGSTRYLGADQFGEMAYQWRFMGPRGFYTQMDDNFSGRNTRFYGPDVDPATSIFPLANPANHASTRRGLGYAQ